MKKISAKLRFILINIAIALVLICGITIYVLSSLDNYTQHGTSIPVPSFYDMTPEEASQVAAHAHLRIEVIDSLYDENAKPGTVIEQYPASDSPVKENRLIHLTLCSHNPEKVVFPNLRNAAYRQTLQTLESRGFRIGHIEYIPSEFKNLVLQLKNKGKEVQPGELLNKGAVINIVLGSGDGSNIVILPQLTKKTLREAIDILRKSYLNVGEIIPDGSILSSTDKLSAYVYQQVPGMNNAIEAGTPVNLYITLNEEKLVATDTLMVME